ncbi:MerR family transcriptional regulator [Lactococcus garvieae]|uniref:MerR family transcriptional regulator n=1 Tax=Lactococcus garvieae TaxID=1363 RepID=UPI00324A4096
MTQVNIHSSLESESKFSLIITLIQQFSETKPSLGIFSQKELLSQLNISPNTLKSWEKLGLKRLEPPIEGTRTVYYKTNDVVQFLTS